MKQRLIWLPMIVLVAVSLACAVLTRDRVIQGSGNIVTEEIDVSGFDSVTLSGFGEVILTQGEKESLVIETDDNLMQYIEADIRGGTLELRITDDDILLNPSDSIIFHVGVINLTALDSEGAGKFEIGELKTERLEITVDGAGVITIDSLTANDLVVTIAGAGEVELAGEVDTQEINLSGIGKYNAPSLQSLSARVRVPGAGSVVIWVYKTLDVTIDGAGSVGYYGSPEVTQDISGVGSLTSLDDK